jgi:hypothetical protein
VITAFLMGCAVSLVAALPAVFFLRGGIGAAVGVRLKLWAIGLAIRFGIIGAVLYYLFTRTKIDRIPVLLGVVVVYFLIFFIESRKTLRS